MGDRSGPAAHSERELEIAVAALHQPLAHGGGLDGLLRDFAWDRMDRVYAPVLTETGGT